MARRAALGFVLLSVLISPLRRELYVGDETKYTQVVREMRTGSFFLPTLNGTPFTHKPPVHFWLVDLLTHVFGVYSIWPFVIPSLVAFGILLWLLHRMAGPMAAFVAGTSLMVWGSAQTARMDLEFTALLVLAAWMIERYFDRDEFRVLLVAAIAVGVAILIKGPMAPVIAIALFVFESIRRRRKPRLRELAAVLIVVVIPLLWFVPALLLGGEAFWREIFYKQTVGRAVGSWVHRSPPWFYLVRAPLTLMPWFFLLVAALVAAYKRADARAKFAVSWLLAVVVPYTLLSSKLDVYMMAAIPPVAIVIARLLERHDGWWIWGRRANATMLAIFALVATAGLLVKPEQIKGPDGALIALPLVRALFIVLLVAAIHGLLVTLRSRDLVKSTLATGVVLVAMFVWAALALVPIANEMASTRPLVAAIQKQSVPAQNVACFVCPHLWIRGMPRELERVRLVDAASLPGTAPQVIVTRRKDADTIATTLAGYRKVDEFRMIGKWFDVYRR
jgi:4-amino-4-deoxy-L-arabinose transferase-like glycosyltransferase